MDALHSDGRFTGVGGVEIYWQCWLPSGGELDAVVLLAHGGAEHSGRYDWVAEQLVAHGYGVYAIDHRGHGRSGGPRAYVDRLANAATDLHTLSDLARERHSSASLFLLGHSMGGLVGLDYACRYQNELAGLVLSAPLAVLKVNAPTRLVSRVLSRLAPRLPVYKIDGTTVSRDPNVVSTYDSDPLNHRGMLPARTIGEFAAMVEKLPERLAALHLPILTLYGTGDRLVDTRGSAMVDSCSASDDCTVRRYDGLYHELLNEPEREQVLADIADWLDARVPAFKPAG